MRCELAVLLACLCLVSLSGQEVSSPSTASPQGVSGSLSQELNGLASMLEQALIDSETDWGILSSTLTGLSSKLENLATLSRGLERENESTRMSLADLETSLKQAEKEAKKRNLELWLLRGGTVLGIAGTIAAVVWGFSK